MKKPMKYTVNVSQNLLADLRGIDRQKRWVSRYLMNLVAKEDVLSNLKIERLLYELCGMRYYRVEDFVCGLSGGESVLYYNNPRASSSAFGSCGYRTSSVLKALLIAWRIGAQIDRGAIEELVTAHCSLLKEKRLLTSSELTVLWGVKENKVRSFSFRLEKAPPAEDGIWLLNDQRRLISFTDHLDARIDVVTSVKTQKSIVGELFDLGIKLYSKAAADMNLWARPPQYKSNTFLHVTKPGPFAEQPGLVPMSEV
jgi:hypothetical protein